MVATSSTFYLEGQDNTRIAVSREHLHALFAQIEAELRGSDIYQKALHALGTAPTDARPPSQSVIKAVGREAIRLALKHLIQQYRVAPAAPAGGEPVPAQSSPPAAAPPAATAAPTAPPPAAPPPAAIATAPGTTAAAAAPTPLSPSTYAPKAGTVSRIKGTAPATTSALAKAPAARRPVKPKSPAEEKRAAVLRTLGQQLRQARENQALTLEHLHIKTWVPLHQLRSLELGQVEALPEDIYIEGFVRRLAPLLQVNQDELLAPLRSLRAAPPIPNVSKKLAAMPPQAKPQRPSLQPAHLYLGYAALMTGAASGLMWLAQQPYSERWVPEMPDLGIRDFINPTRDVEIPPPYELNRGAIADPETRPPEGAAWERLE